MTRPAALQTLYQRIHECSQLARFDEAKAACEEVLRIAPSEAVAWYCLGEIERGRQQPAAAVVAFRRSVSLARNNLDYLRGLCVSLHESRQWQEAIGTLRKYLAQRHDDVEAWGMLAGACEGMSLNAEAAAAYETCLALVPDNIPAAVRCGELWCLARQPSCGLEIVELSLKRHPREPRLLRIRSQVCLMMKRWQEAVDSSRQCLAACPTDVQAQLFLAIALMRLWRLGEAERQCRAIVAGDPRNADAYGLLGLLLRMQGRAAEALATFEAATRLSDEPGFHSNVLLTMQYMDGFSAESLYAAHRERAVRFGGGSAAPRPERSGRPSGRALRLGFVSGDLGIQATSFLAIPFLEALDKTECVVCIYSDRTDEDDALTRRFKGAAQLWRDTAGWSTAQLVERIRQDEIDVLVDWMGHTGHRLEVFAQRPAPTQLTWLGYVGTTGLEEIDFLVADRFHVPVGEEPYYAERVLRMPHGYVCYSPLDPTPDVQPLPALENGYVTFGSFNNPSKFTATTLKSWAEVLKAVPRSKLLLKYGGLDDMALQTRVRWQLAEHGIEGERVLFSGWTTASELFDYYNRVDMALDTHPYSGGVTTCEALWMGVPVITCPGRTFASRHSTSHVTNAGYPEFVAQDLATYVEIAARWAGRIDELASVRQGMRSRVAASPLCNAAALAADFLSLIRGHV